MTHTERDDLATATALETERRGTALAFLPAELTRIASTIWGEVSSGMTSPTSAARVLRTAPTEQTWWLPELNTFTATVAQPAAAVQTPTLELRGLQQRHPALTNLVRRLVEQAWAIVVSKALDAHFPIVATEVDVMRDPDEEKTEVRLWVRTIGTVSQTIAFWDSLGPSLSDWIAGLPTEHQRNQARHTIRLYFTWKPGGARA